MTQFDFHFVDEKAAKDGLKMAIIIRITLPRISNASLILTNHPATMITKRPVVIVLSQENERHCDDKKLAYWKSDYLYNSFISKNGIA